MMRAAVFLLSLAETVFAAWLGTEGLCLKEEFDITAESACCAAVTDGKWAFGITAWDATEPYPFPAKPATRERCVTFNTGDCQSASCRAAGITFDKADYNLWSSGAIEAPAADLDVSNGSRPVVWYGLVPSSIAFSGGNTWPTCDEFESLPLRWQATLAWNDFLDGTNDADLITSDAYVHANVSCRQMCEYTYLVFTTAPSVVENFPEVSPVCADGAEPAMPAFADFLTPWGINLLLVALFPLFVFLTFVGL